MRALLLSAALLAGCGLVTPFELGHPPDGAPADADGDTDSDADGDVGQDGDAPIADDADVPPPYDYLAGCLGGVTEEKWAVAALDGVWPSAYITGRDCRNPIEICTGCYPAAISPRGDRVLVTYPTKERWRLEDELALVRLDTPEPDRVDLGLKGSHPTWVDDDTFYYFAIPDGVTEPCLEGDGQPDVTEMRRHVLSTGAEEVIGPLVDRAWRGGAIVPAPGGRMLGVGEEATHTCKVTNLAITRMNLGSEDQDQLVWTASEEQFFALGRLPDGGGFLMQRLDHWTDTTSRLYAVPFQFHGKAARILEEQVIEASHDRWLLEGPEVGGETPAFVDNLFAGCATARRVGPSCEIYCRRPDHSRIDRYYLDGRAPEPVTCEGLGEDVRIMDVWQR